MKPGSQSLNYTVKAATKWLLQPSLSLKVILSFTPQPLVIYSILNPNHTSKVLLFIPDHLQILPLSTLHNQRGSKSVSHLVKDSCWEP